MPRNRVPTRLFFDTNVLFDRDPMDKLSSPRQRLEDFRAFLEQPQNTDAAQGAADIWSRGPGSKSGITTLAKRFDSSNARQAVRDQVKQLLRDNHIAITADIRKALPSRTAPGNAASLSQLLDTKAMPLQVPDLASLTPHLKFEIDKLAAMAASGQPPSFAKFLLHDSGTAKQALVSMLAPGLQAKAEDMAMQAFDVFARSLMFGKGIDEAMERTYQELRTQCQAIKPGKEFSEAVAILSHLLDGTRAAAADNSAAINAATGVAAFVGDATQSVRPALIAAVLTPTLAGALDARQKLFHMAVTDNCTVRGAAPPESEPQMAPHARVEVDAAQLWALRPSMLAERLAKDISAGSIHLQ